MKYVFAVLGTLLLAGCNAAPVETTEEENVVVNEEPAVEEEVVAEEEVEAEDAIVEIEAEVEAAVE